MFRFIAVNSTQAYELEPVISQVLMALNSSNHVESQTCKISLHILMY